MRWKAWTTGEVRRLVDMRMTGSTLKECAKAMGRSRQSCAVQLHRRGVVRQPKVSDGSDVRMVRLHHTRGRSDAFIAAELGMTRRRVRYIREKIGLKANRPMPWGAKHRMRCWACGTLCPITQRRGWAERSGWQLRLCPASRDVEAYCPECFARWGWPMIVERVEVIRGTSRTCSSVVQGSNAQVG